MKRIGSICEKKKKDGINVKHNEKLVVQLIVVPEVLVKLEIYSPRWQPEPDPNIRVL